MNLLKSDLSAGRALRPGSFGRIVFDYQSEFKLVANGNS